MLGRPDTGVLGEGSRADFVVLGGDPLADIGAVRDVRGVFVAGQQLVTEGGEIRPLAPAGMIDA
jgi:imidazolonepropionase-like amidohydrolase